MGEIIISEGVEVDPGGAFECRINFIFWPELMPEITPGREWRVQEGGKLVGIGRVIKVLDD